MMREKFADDLGFSGIGAFYIHGSIAVDSFQLYTVLLPYS